MYINLSLSCRITARKSLYAFVRRNRRIFSQQRNNSGKKTIIPEILPKDLKTKHYFCNAWETTPKGYHRNISAAQVPGKCLQQGMSGGIQNGVKERQKKEWLYYTKSNCF